MELKMTLLRLMASLNDRDNKPTVRSRPNACNWGGVTSDT